MPTPPNPNPYGYVEEPFRSSVLLPAFYGALGQFINWYGQTETSLMSFLELYALGLIGGGRGINHDDLKLDVLRALLGDKSIEQIFASTRLCMKAWSKAGRPYSTEVDQELKDQSGQLGHIRYLRNRAVHYGSHIQVEKDITYFRTLNRYTVDDIEKSEEVLYRIEDLEAATDDLKTIHSRFPRAIGITKWDLIGTKLPLPRAPWRYKPTAIIRRPYEFPPTADAPAVLPSAWWD